MTKTNYDARGIVDNKLHGNMGFFDADGVIGGGRVWRRPAVGHGQSPRSILRRRDASATPPCAGGTHAPLPYPHGAAVGRRMRSG